MNKLFQLYEEVSTFLRYFMFLHIRQLFTGYEGNITGLKIEILPKINISLLDVASNSFGVGPADRSSLKLDLLKNACFVGHFVG